jgi:hypothetical protein
MLRIFFEGYYQARIPTDPDPTDERRGVSGYTFALPGEPDFDGLLHFQPDPPGTPKHKRQVFQRKYGWGKAARSGPQVGVRVTRALRDHEPIRALEGAELSFLDSPQLLELNGILIRNDFFVIHPLRVQVRKGKNVYLDRLDYLDPARPNLELTDATSEMLLRRQPQGFLTNSPEVAQATGLPDASDKTLIKNREERRANLEELLEHTEDETEREALHTRIEQLRILKQWWNLSQTPRPIDRRAYTLALQAYGWNIDMNGPVTASDPALRTDASRPWLLQFWMGGWDADALCAYVSGEWQIPEQDDIRSTGRAR